MSECVVDCEEKVRDKHTGGVMTPGRHQHTSVTLYQAYSNEYYQRTKSLYSNLTLKCVYLSKLSSP